jgi:hypothetical protein
LIEQADGRKLSSMGGKKKRGQTLAELQRAIFIKKNSNHIYNQSIIYPTEMQNLSMKLFFSGQHIYGKL